MVYVRAESQGQKLACKLKLNWEVSI